MFGGLLGGSKNCGKCGKPCPKCGKGKLVPVSRGGGQHSHTCSICSYTDAG